MSILCAGATFTIVVGTTFGDTVAGSSSSFSTGPSSRSQAFSTLLYVRKAEPLVGKVLEHGLPTSFFLIVDNGCFILIVDEMTLMRFCSGRLTGDAADNGGFAVVLIKGFLVGVAVGSVVVITLSEPRSSLLPFKEMSAGCAEPA